jgi:alkylated DNA repair protein alkB family protein 1
MNWLRRCLLEYPEPPNVTNLSVDGSYSGADVFLNASQRLRWVTLGNDYDWTTKEYAEKPRSLLPKELQAIAKVMSQVLGLGAMDADAAILNYYPNKATLSPHIDRSERDIAKPLISLSFGQSAVYLTGGRSLDDPVDAIMLHSGDILVMHADQRLVYHAVPRIICTTRFEDKTVERHIVEYANKCRVNITLREVD